MRHKILDAVGYTIFVALLFGVLYGLIFRNPDWFWLTAGCTVGALLGKGISSTVRGWLKNRKRRQEQEDR